MKSTIKTLLQGQPHDYYCIVSDEPSYSAVSLPDFITDGRELFIGDPLRIYSSKKLASDSSNLGEEPLHLICLVCFLNAVRSRLGLEDMLVDGTWRCKVVAWRAPCQTTAILRDQGDEYYIEGCRDSGVYWKPISEEATTPPPFLECGAPRIDCLWHECPNGWQFMDDDPVTLCEIKKNEILKSSHGQCTVRFRTDKICLYYAGISEEGFDLGLSETQAIRLNAEDASRVAVAIANVHMNWSGGIMTGQRHCSVAVLDEHQNELLLME